MKVLHKKSAVKGKSPDNSVLGYGEIAVNYNSEDPFLSIRKSDDSVVRISSDEKWNEAVANVDKKLADYLPLGGGALKGPFGSLIIERNDTVDGYSGICFKNQYGTLGYIGMGGGASDFGKQPTFYDGSDSYALIHSGNIGSYKAGSASTADDSNKLGGVAAAGYALAKDYLALSGGTLTGPFTVNSNFELTGYINTRQHYLFVRNNDNAEWIVTNKNWQSEYALLHTGNSAHTHDYLPLSGGSMSGGINFQSTHPLTWADGSYWQRIQSFDNSTSGDAVFIFQQSSDSGTTWSNLATITDDSKVYADTFVGNLKGGADAAYYVTSYSEASNSDHKRRIWFDWSNNGGHLAYSDN